MEVDPVKFEGCLLGLSIGDALGMPFEGWRPAMIVNKLGGRVSRFEPNKDRGLKAGQWTDDTKMALQLARSIIRKKGAFDPDDAARAYEAWFDSGDLRGIGATIAESILKLKSGVPWNESGRKGELAAGNGTAMRAAPLGLLNCTNISKLKEDSKNDALITHNNEEAVAGSRAVNFFVARGASGAGFSEARPKLIDECVDFIGPCRLASNLLRAKELLKDGLPSGTALQTLGTGGYVVESVAGAVFCFLKTPDRFDETVISAVMGGGDTDTLAAIAGAISGAWNGTWALPKNWVDSVESSEEIRAIAGKLYDYTMK